MKSIIDISWGKPKLENGVVAIPFNLTLCAETGKGPDIEHSYVQVSVMRFMPKTVARGQESIEKCIHQIMEDSRDEYGPISIGRFTESAIDFVRKCDLTVFVHPSWAKAATPSRPTFH